MPFPLGLERGDIHNDAAAGIGRLADTDREHIAGDAEVLHAPGQREGIGRNNADISLDIDKRLLVELLGVDHRAVDIGEDLELVGNAEVITVTGKTVADEAAVIGGTDLTFGEGFDHPLFQGHFADPAVGADGHSGGIEAEETFLRKVNFADPRPSSA